MRGKVSALAAHGRGCDPWRPIVAQTGSQGGDLDAEGGTLPGTDGGRP